MVVIFYLSTAYFLPLTIIFVICVTLKAEYDCLDHRIAVYYNITDSKNAEIKTSSEPVKNGLVTKTEFDEENGLVSCDGNNDLDGIEAFRQEHQKVIC